ncbi:hypothetical protein D9613_009322 [Agrocybe pediades]|uniref:DUF6534 domain-containing protein n=1 Tax=Agrocybe pediades TaxID=84607 RepID=A0A8H4R3K5_9AGAR|nr:hypothetical protein D9613_009322 [Agrocybe pediades]
MTLLFKSAANSSTVDIPHMVPYMVFALLSDACIAAALIYLLQGHRSGFKRTDTIVSRLIIFTLNRGLIITIFSTTECLFHLKFPHTLWSLGMDYVLCKLYANSFLTSLNSRNIVSGMNDEAMSESVPLSRLDKTQPRNKEIGSQGSASDV